MADFDILGLLQDLVNAARGQAGFDEGIVNKKVREAVGGKPPARKRPAATAKPKPRPTAKPTPRPTPKPTLRPGVKAAIAMLDKAIAKNEAERAAKKRPKRSAPQGRTKRTSGGR